MAAAVEPTINQDVPAYAVSARTGRRELGMDYPIAAPRLVEVSSIWLAVDDVITRPRAYRGPLPDNHAQA